MKKNNKGYSLVELIIVIAILAVITGISFYGLTMLSGQYAKEVANNLGTVLDTEKNHAKTRSAEVDCFVEISYNADGNLYAEYYVPEKVVGTATKAIEKAKLGRGQVEVTFTFTSGSTYTLAQGEYMRVTYDRVSGAFKDFTSSTGSSGMCSKITVMQGGRKYLFTLHTATGKYVMERVTN